MRDARVRVIRGWLAGGGAGLDDAEPGALCAQIEVVEGAKKRVTRLVKPLLERPRRNPPPGEAQRYRDMGIRPRPFRRPAL